MDIEKYEPAERVYHLRKSGFSFTDIAERMEITTPEAFALFRNFQIQMAASYSIDDRKALIQLELDRLDDLQQATYQDALAGDLKAVETTLKIMVHRMKLLGLDQITPSDAQQIANILIVGNEKQAFLEALMNGRNQHSLGSADSDDGVEREEGS